jgi:hypothetical protein
MILENKKIECLVVLYRIDGIYGDVTYCKGCITKDGIIEEFDSFEDIIHANCNQINNLFTSKFSVCVKDDFGNTLYEKFDIDGLPWGLGMDEYFKMAQLQQNKASNSIVNLDGLKLEITNDAIEGLKKELLEGLKGVTAKFRQGI